MNLTWAKVHMFGRGRLKSKKTPLTPPSSPYFLHSFPVLVHRQCIAKRETPHLMLMSKERIYSSIQEPVDDLSVVETTWQQNYH